VSTAREVAEQIAYYRAIANEYEDHHIDAPGGEEIWAAIDAFHATGDVLELACGPGVWTQRLLRTATTVTAVDASSEMIARAKARVQDPRVQFIEANLLSWQPQTTYDAVVFGFWISHVPENSFDAFWSLVSACLNKEGRVFFMDDNHRTEAELIEGPDSPMVQRRLNDGTPFRVVKVPYDAAQLEARLRAMGWDITVQATAGPFYWGQGQRQPSAQH
jgi:2-polyprenyl-3-methyl-5-hydroxy-6-metoxy-1,4-benzoquinol methylase